MKTGFVILHYMTADDTINCVESIKEKCFDYEIVIVDNASPNGSGKILETKYSKESKINVLTLEKNIGFACGNNAGINFLRNKDNFSFICTLNNDTVILSDNFEKKIADEFEKSGFAVLGPQIITLDNKNNSSPVEYVVDTVKKTNILIFKRRIKLLMEYCCINFIRKNSKKHISQNEKYNHTEMYKNVKLHGACWVFSKNFFNKLDGLNESTFLYFEEDILYNELKKNCLLSVYQPELTIKHLEDSSTNVITKTVRNKNIFIFRNEIKSLKVLRRILRNKE